MHRALDPAHDRRATLATVADVAGTSIPTVSKVLRGGTDVSSATRARVFDAVRSTGYQRKRRSGSAQFDTASPTLIDLVVNHVEGSWANRVLVGVEGEASAAGLDVAISLALEGREWQTRLLRRPSMGAIVALMDPTSSKFQALVAARVPVVLIDPVSESAEDIPSVGVANWDGGRLAAEHLISLGHRRFGIIAGERSHAYSRARVDGFRSTMAAHHGDISVDVAYGDWSRERARHACYELLGENHAITAIFACSDVMALGVYDALSDLNLRVPGDVSVVGFDDVPEAEWAQPHLTTIHQPIVKMGAVAVRMLLNLLRSPDTAHTFGNERLEMATTLVVRKSTAIAPVHATT